MVYRSENTIEAFRHADPLASQRLSRSQRQVEVSRMDRRIKIVPIDILRSAVQEQSVRISQSFPKLASPETQKRIGTEQQDDQRSSHSWLIDSNALNISRNNDNAYLWAYGVLSHQILTFSHNKLKVANWANSRIKSRHTASRARYCCQIRRAEERYSTALKRTNGYV